MLSNMRSLKDLFSRNARIWYVFVPAFNNKLNEADVSTFLRENMEVVYEDFGVIVMFRGDNHWTVSSQAQDESQLQRAKANFLP